DRKAKREAKRARRNDAIDQKAAKRNRKAEAALAKQERATHKKDAKLRAKDRKMADKIDAAGRKHEYKLAALELDKIKAGKFGKDDDQRWLSVATVATPVPAPKDYQIDSKEQGPSNKPSGGGAFDAQAAGINPTGPGPALGSRIV